MEDGGKPNLHKGKPTINYVKVSNLEKFGGIDPLEYFIGRREYRMIPKPIKYEVKFKGVKIKQIISNIWNLIKELFNREYDLICNLDWKSDEGREIDMLLIAYNQLVAEEDKRVRDEMDKNIKNRK